MIYTWKVPVEELVISSVQPIKYYLQKQSFQKTVYSPPIVGDDALSLQQDRTDESI